MFAPDSRYASQPVYTVTRPDGTQVTAVVPPLPSPAPLVGYSATVRPGPPRPPGGAVPQCANRLLAAVRLEQLHGRRALSPPAR